MQTSYSSILGNHPDLDNKYFLRSDFKTCPPVHFLLMLFILKKREFLNTLITLSSDNGPVLNDGKTTCHG